jgi:hypothetical protein
MMRFAVSIVLPSLLAGCMTAQQGLEQAHAKVAGQDKASCLSNGTQPGTDAYFACRVRLEATRMNAAAPAPAAVAQTAPDKVDPPPPIICMKTGTMTTCDPTP